MRKLWFLPILLGAVGGVSFYAIAQQENPAEEVKKQKELLLKEMGILPGDVYAEQGRDMFNKPMGNAGKSCSSCHGQDGRYLRGAYAHMPRYYKDMDAVADLDTRIKYCMEKYMGVGNVKHDLNFKSIATYVATLSNGMKMDVKLTHPKEREMYEKGRELWYARVGKMDFSCAICHDTFGGQRIRLQTLAKVKEDKVATHWPAYRFSNDQLWTMEDRIRGCYNQIRVTPPPHFSWPQIALSLYMAYESNGGTIETPGFVR
ncbi:sulfur oxidation c-type cytochrome SoxA [Hydrogenobacter thermophilus]|uniref:sulfur oxidation c-type cytochrome SoxA n=1 Tax=Hydrogenobacter thermophilus TaxID=940 RepID=UPI0030FBE014